MAPNREEPGILPFTPLSAVPDQSRVVWFADVGGEAAGPWDERVDPERRGGSFIRGNEPDRSCVVPRHGGKVNVGFVDGHVELLNPEEIDWGPKGPPRKGNLPYIGYTTFTVAP